MVFERLGTNFKVVAYGGVTPTRTDGALEDLPQVTAQAKAKGLAHGLSNNDPRASELARYFGLGSAATFLLAPIAPDHSHTLVAYGDSRPSTGMVACSGAKALTTRPRSSS